MKALKTKITKLSEEQKLELYQWLSCQLTPETDDFTDEDWEEVDRKKCDGEDELDAIRSVRQFIDEENAR